MRTCLIVHFEIHAGIVHRKNVIAGYRDRFPIVHFDRIGKCDGQSLTVRGHVYYRSAIFTGEIAFRPAPGALYGRQYVFSIITVSNRDES